MSNTDLAYKRGFERGLNGETWVDGSEEIFNMSQNSPEYREAKDQGFEDGKAERERRAEQPRCK